MEGSYNMVAEELAPRKLLEPKMEQIHISAYNMVPDEIFPLKILTPKISHFQVQIFRGRIDLEMTKISSLRPLILTIFSQKMQSATPWLKFMTHVV